MASPRLRNPTVHIALFVAALLAGSMLVSTLTILLAYQLLGSDLGQHLSQPQYMVVLVLFYLPQFLFYLGLVTLFVRRVEHRPLAVLGMAEGSSWHHLRNGALIGALLIIVVMVLIWLLDGVTVAPATPSWWSLFWYALLFAMVAVGEELVFRGYLYFKLSEYLPRHPAMLAGAVLFTLVHMANPALHSLGLLNIFLAGMLLGTVRLYRGGIWLAIGLHFGWNVMQGPILGLAVSGIPISGVLQTTMSGAGWLTGGEFGLEGSVPSSLVLLLAWGLLYPRRESDRPDIRS